MLISVKHVTTYEYDEEANYTIQSLRLTPRSFAGQNVLSWSLSLEDKSKVLSYTDCYGNEVRTLTIAEPHSKVEICAEGLVETQDKNGVITGLFELAPVSVFLRATQQTLADDAIKNLAKQSVKSSPLSTLHDLNARILDQVQYEKGSTDSKTSAADALEKQKGVCQDHTHIFISAARTLDIPARYVTGYLVTEDADEAHHAWAEVFVKDLGWVGFDVSNQICPTEKYVRLACGLDAEDAAPIRGTFQGGANESLRISVDVQQHQ